MPMASTTIYNLPIAELRGCNISIELSATPCRIRLINCRALIEEETLVIDEFEDFPLPLNPDYSRLPKVLYAAISYVWKGNEGDEEEGRGYFTVQGAESGDPISISVLYSACLAARIYSINLVDLAEEIDYIWLDRLCIMQGHREDKSWQIARMFPVYKNSQVTIILPGGIRRLVGLDEETAWVHRAWTLQEALAKRSEALVLHRWEEGEGSVGSWEEETAGAIALIQASKPGRMGCATTTLVNLVEACTKGSLRWTPGIVKEGDETPRDWRLVKNVKIIGQPGTPSLDAFADVQRTGLTSGRHYAIWKNALTRTSSRPVDMVFSIMGLFDVYLDPNEFGENDRIGATIALSREILHKGGTASWIGFATRAPPCRQLSTFPEFPETSVAGRALIKVNASPDVIDASTVVDEDSCMVEGSLPLVNEGRSNMIRGEMDETGYLNFRRRACVITPVDTALSLVDCTECLRTVENPTVHLSVKSVDGKAWYFHEGVDFDQCKFPRTAAVVLAYFVVSGEHDEVFKMMLVQEHAPRKFHVTSYFKISDVDLTWAKKQVIWKEFGFSVGGPD